MHTAAAAVIGLFLIGVPNALALPAGVGALQWNDEFDGTSIDSTKWSCYTPGVWSDAVNTPSAASVAGGVMKISTYTESGTNYTSVWSTKDKYFFPYGYFEARVQFNTSPGMWSAFYLQSPTNGQPVGSPATAGTEIDVVEHRAVNDLGAVRTNYTTTALHWDGYGANEQSTSQLNGPLAGLGNGSWHTYGLLWTPDSYTFYYDDGIIGTWTTPVSQRTEYLLLSSEVENNSWAGNIPTGGYGTAATSTTNVQYDYVRVYSVPEPMAGGLVLLALMAAGRRREGRGMAR